MKLYANYIKERLGREMLLFPDVGFVTFQIEGSECYIVDIHVEKEYRKQNVASRLADEVVKTAKERGCTVLKGSVAVNSNNPDISIHALLGYGLKPVSATDNFIIFKKDI